MQPQKTSDVLKNAFHKLVETIISKKFFTLLLVSFLLFNGNLSEEVFALVALSFMGVTGFLDYKAQALKWSSQNAAPGSAPSEPDAEAES